MSLNDDESRGGYKRRPTDAPADRSRANDDGQGARPQHDALSPRSWLDGLGSPRAQRDEATGTSSSSPLYLLDPTADPVGGAPGRAGHADGGAGYGAVQAMGDLAGPEVQATASQGVATAASPLPHLDRIQESFGSHDVSHVRAQVGGPATDAAGAIGASAYATGHRVAFADPNPSLHTAAHEAAHVVQQRSGVSLMGGVGQSGDVYERHANAVADKVVAGESAQALLDPHAGASGNTATAVQRFDGDEHKKAGDEATKGERLREFADSGIDLSFGDGVMLSGDLLGYLEKEQPINGAPRKSTADYLRDLLRLRGQDGRDELKYALWYARSGSTRGPEPKVPEEIKDRVKARYLQLAAENESHFSTGGTARNTYEDLHNRALMKAYQSKKNNKPALFEEAKTDEAFAQHYLSDMFASGHVRTPRSKLLGGERNRDMPSIDAIIMALARDIFIQLDSAGDFGWKGKVPLVSNVIYWKIVSMIQSKGGDALKAGSYAALLSKAQHDADGEGLDVVSARGPFGPQESAGHKWHSVGDGQMVANGSVTAEGAETYSMVVRAMQVSRTELDEAAEWAGVTDSLAFTPENINAGKALEYVPKATSQNPDMNEGSPAWESAVNEAIRKQVLPRLTEFFPAEATLVESGMTLHVGAAMQGVAAKISASPVAWLRGAMEFTPPNRPASEPEDPIAGMPEKAPRRPGMEGPTDAGVEE